MLKRELKSILLALLPLILVGQQKRKSSQNRVSSKSIEILDDVMPKLAMLHPSIFYILPIQCT